MKMMGMMALLCECHAHTGEDLRNRIEMAVEDNLPEGWAMIHTTAGIDVVLVPS